MTSWGQKQWSVSLTKELISPHAVWHRPPFHASAAPQDEAKINSPCNLTLPVFIIYTHYNVMRFKIAQGLFGKLLAMRTSGISRRRHHLNQWLLNLFFFFFCLDPWYKIIFISWPCTHICKLDKNIHKLNQETHETILSYPDTPQNFNPSSILLKNK